jgi:hypothetical protein
VVPRPGSLIQHSKDSVRCHPVQFEASFGGGVSPTSVSNRFDLHGLGRGSAQREGDWP